MKIIDIGTWKRRALFECFSGYNDPVFSFTVELDVTELVKVTKNSGTSFFANTLYIVTGALNKFEAFRTRISGDDVVVYDTVDPNYVVMNTDGVIVTQRTKWTGDYKTFHSSVRRDSESAKNDTERTEFNNTANDIYYVSCLPWINFTSMKNPYNTVNPSQTSIPRLTWGKYFEKDGGFKMSMDISVHHALMDGYDVAKAFAEIQRRLDIAGDLCREE